MNLNERLKKLKDFQDYAIGQFVWAEKVSPL